MRTTLDIADDVLAEARFVAARDNTSMGAVISQWARDAVRGLHPSNQTKPQKIIDAAPMDYATALKKCTEMGLAPFITGGVPGSVTNELIDRIRDEEGI